MLGERVAIKEFFVKDFCNRDEATAHVTIGTQSKRGLVDKLKRKFIEEAKMLYRMQHPGIVRVFDIFEENSTAYFVMDYIDGPSLSEIVAKEGALSEARAVCYIRQVAEALKYVHDQDRLHLDIKPGNIMVDSNDNAILIDFGASKQYDEVDGENTSTLLGKTPGYAPLEQMGNDVVKFLPATDIYALGATLYKLVTGITPMSANLLASGEELEPLPADVSPSVREAIMRSMNVNKSKRPQTIDDFLVLLGIETKGSQYSKSSLQQTQPIHEEETKLVNEEEVLVIGESKEPAKTSMAETQDLTSSGREDVKLSSNKKRNTIAIGIIIWVLVWLGIGINTTKDQRTNPNSARKMEEYQKEEEKRVTTPCYIKTSPAGALVYINGLYFGATPIEGKEMSRGTYFVKLSKDGYEDKTFTLTFGDKPVVLNETLVEKPQIREITSTLFSVTTTPSGVIVYVDGKYIGTTPIEGTEIIRGNHQIKLSKVGYEDKTFTRTFGDKPVVINETLDKTPRQESSQLPSYIVAEAKRNYEIGYDYYWGNNGKKVNYTEAVKYFRKAADQGNTMALHNIGMCYEHGHGVQKSLSEAVKWYRKAAEQGEVASTFALERLGY